MKGKRDYSGVCRGPDIDVPGLICGHPLPCPRHPKDQEKNKIKEKIMSNDQGKQVKIRSTEIHSKIEANLELARHLSKTATEIEDKILGTSTPYGEAEDTKEPSGGFITTIDRGLRILHSELLHLKDILTSINTEF